MGSLTNVPAGVSNIMSVAAGDNHSIALRNDGTVVAWADDSFGQTNVPIGLTGVKLVAGGGDFSLAIQFSTWVQYNVDVTKDVLLIYNTNSADSAFVENYYRTHRPLASDANVLTIGCATTESTANLDFTNQILNPLLGWFSTNPTKHPQYLILFLGIPSQLADMSTVGSVSFALRQSVPGTSPFVTYINLNGTNDCRAYIDKIANIGINYSPGNLIVGASQGGYGNTNYYFDDVNAPYGVLIGLAGAQSVLTNGVPASAVFYQPTNGTHITQGTNVAGYYTSGSDGGMGDSYYTNVFFKGHSGWYLIETVDSYNGLRENTGSLQGYFLQWFSSVAFGGTNYSSTPVGAVTHVAEPNITGVEDAGIYFGLWSAGKNFAICAWNARKTPFFQAVGDPLVQR